MPFPPYQSMSCDAYSRIELAIMRGQALRVRWQGRGLIHIERLQPMDLRTRKHAEFLLFQDQRTRRRWMRLDRLLTFEELN